MTSKHSNDGAAADQTSPQPRRNGWLLALLLLLLLAAGLAAWWWLSRTPPAAAPPRVLEVQVTSAELRPMPVLLNSVGKVVAQASVEVRAQTSGVLRQVFVQDGQLVKAGQPLFALDAQPLLAALALAQAQWVRDTALADDAAAAQARLKPLAEKEYVTARDYELAVSNRRSLQASAAATLTLIEQARIALAYATINAPIAGRAGAVLVKPGNLVAVNAATPLLVINAISPLELAFALPQEQARQLREAMNKSDKSGAPALAVEARDSLTQQLRASGELVFIDNTLDAVSGTVTLKARFANADEALWPGEFYAVRITLRTDAAALTVPERALQQGQAGPFVYVLDGGVARLRPLTVDRLLDGRAVITAGLKAGEVVIASVPSNLREGTAVRAIAAAASAAAPSVRSASAPASAAQAAR